MFSFLLWKLTYLTNKFNDLPICIRFLDFLFLHLSCSQIWLNPRVADCRFWNNMRKLEKKHSVVTYAEIGILNKLILKSMDEKKKLFLILQLPLMSTYPGILNKWILIKLKLYCIIFEININSYCNHTFPSDCMPKQARIVIKVHSRAPFRVPSRVTTHRVRCYYAIL